MAIIIIMKQGRDVGPGEHFCPLQGKVVGKVGVSLSQNFSTSLKVLKNEGLVFAFLCFNISCLDIQESCDT